MGILKKFFDKIFNKKLEIADTTYKNYKEFESTYKTLKLFNKLNDIDAYLIGGISAPIQTNNDLYRQNSDLDIMCKEEDLDKLINFLKEKGYKIDDRRGIKTRNKVDTDGKFLAYDHELNADFKTKKMLGIGIFTFKEENEYVITNSYAYEEKEGKVIGNQKIIPKELFDLMYEKNKINYKGTTLKTQSKEYVYITKSKGKRQKDKMDADLIFPYLDEKSKSKIKKIQEQQTKIKTKRIYYSQDGKIEKIENIQSLEEKVNSYLNKLQKNNSLIDVKKQVYESKEYERLIKSHPQLDYLIENWAKNKEDSNYANENVDIKIDIKDKNKVKEKEDIEKKDIDQER